MFWHLYYYSQQENPEFKIEDKTIVLQQIKMQKNEENEKNEDAAIEILIPNSDVPNHDSIFVTPENFDRKEPIICHLLNIPPGTFESKFEMSCLNSI